LITSKEWEILAANYEFDMAITVRRMPSNLTQSDDDNSHDIVAKASMPEHNPKWVFQFRPNICQICLAQNELEKYTFENKKIIVRLVDDEETAPTTTTKTSVKATNDNSNNSSGNEAATSTTKRAKSPLDNNDDDCEITYSVSSRKFVARFKVSLLKRVFSFDFTFLEELEKASLKR
jgi:hypothetical protein